MAPLLCFVPFAAFLLWGVISPRSQWQRLVAWRYRHPEANEPSDAAYAFTRVGNLIVLVGLVAAAIGIATAVGDDDRSAATGSAAAPSNRTGAPSDNAALRAAFGADRAEFVPFLGQQAVPPVASKPALRPVRILRRQAVEPSTSPAWLPNGHRLLAGTRLVVSVSADATPAAVVVQEAADRVTVTIYTACASCPTAPPSAAVAGAVVRVYLLPVQLGQPLGARPVVDGSTAAAVE
jgi:hypothetical protein